MDGIPDKIRLEVSNLISSVTEPSAPWQMLLRLTADFRILVDGVVVYQETDFPVVELAGYLQKWASQGDADLRFTSMESEDDPRFSFSRDEFDEYVFSSPYQETGVPMGVPSKLLRSEVLQFIKEIRDRCFQKFGLNIQPALDMC
jgi:hypothetical protein